MASGRFGALAAMEVVGPGRGGASWPFAGVGQKKRQLEGGRGRGLAAVELRRNPSAARWGYWALTRERARRKINSENMKPLDEEIVGPKL